MEELQIKRLKLMVLIYSDVIDLVTTMVVSVFMLTKIYT